MFKENCPLALVKPEATETCHRMAGQALPRCQRCHQYAGLDRVPDGARDEARPHADPGRDGH